METTQARKPIKELVELSKKGMMIANPEYQRGEVWTLPQKKRLIDSLFRGFTIPLIYLHRRKDVVGDLTRDALEIIDGQQRLTAICDYVEGAFPLFDPSTENEQAKFPRFLVGKDCAWAGEFYRDLSQELKDKLSETELLLAMIESDDMNEIRDLFVRLQAGSALRQQERRDAMPGGMTEFILWLGGKPEIRRYPGHAFFREVMGRNPRSDRGSTRQLAAQITCLLFAQQRNVGATLPTINSSAIDYLYYDNLDFEADGADGRRITQVFDLLNGLVRDGTRPKLRAHDAIHAALLVNRLRDGFSPAWQDEFPSALDNFLHNLREAPKDDDQHPKYRYWSQYGNWTRTNSDRGDRITQRHEFYISEMLAEMPATTPRDPTRHFTPEMRELIYLQQRKKCASCGGNVIWSDAEIHHVQEHRHGGRTTLENAALVHKECHPRSSSDVAEFAKQWHEKRESR